MVLLSHFQPGVGAVPIDVEISKDNPTVKEWRERKERVEKWLEPISKFPAAVDPL
jgi:hypothetical protein